MNKLIEKLQFDKINIEYLVAVIFLGAALIVGTCQGVETLAGNIAAGMVGYFGGRASANAEKAKAEKYLPSPPPNSAYEKLSDEDKKKVDEMVEEMMKG